MRVANTQPAHREFQFLPLLLTLPALFPAQPGCTGRLETQTLSPFLRVWYSIDGLSTISRIYIERRASMTSYLINMRACEDEEGSGRYIAFAHNRQETRYFHFLFFFFFFFFLSRVLMLLLLDRGQYQGCITLVHLVRCC